MAQKKRKIPKVSTIDYIKKQWENTGHNNEIESMFELEGLSFYSKPRSKTVKGVSNGGVAIIVNTKKFTAEKLDVHFPSNVEAYWLLVKPKTISSTVKEIVACSFYSPPSNNKKKNEALAEHIISNLHLMSTRYQNCAIILGADKNAMNLSPIIDCGLKLRQMVNTNTRGSKILDIIIMNMGRFYNDAVVHPQFRPTTQNLENQVIMRFLCVLRMSIVLIPQFVNFERSNIDLYLSLV